MSDIQIEQFKRKGKGRRKEGAPAHRNEQGVAGVQCGLHHTRTPYPGRTHAAVEHVLKPVQLLPPCVTCSQSHTDTHKSSLFGPSSTVSSNKRTSSAQLITMRVQYEAFAATPARLKAPEASAHCEKIHFCRDSHTTTHSTSYHSSRSASVHIHTRESSTNATTDKSKSGIDAPDK